MYKTQEIKVLGIDIEIRDLETSNTVKWVEQELNEGDYNLANISFQKDDYVIDVGANVGIVAIYLAKKYPFITVYAYEPLLDNYLNLLHNRWINGTSNVHCIHGAIGNEYGLIDIAVNNDNMGGSHTQEGESYVCYSLDDVTKTLFKNHFKHKARLLKVDCEGYEVEIFKKDYTGFAEYLSIETHGYMPELVMNNIKKFNDNLWIKEA